MTQRLSLLGQYDRSKYAKDQEEATRLFHKEGYVGAGFTPVKLSVLASLYKMMPLSIRNRD